jgi:hypothetical protein
MKDKQQTIDKIVKHALRYRCYAMPTSELGFDSSEADEAVKQIQSRLGDELHVEHCKAGYIMVMSARRKHAH